MPILRSDVDLRARMIRAGEHATAPLPLGPLPARELRAALTQLIDETLLAGEAERLGVARPTERDLARERARLANLAGGATRLGALLDALGADRREVDAHAARRASVSVFLVANLDAAPPTDAEVAEFHARTGEHPFGDRPLEDVRDALRAYMMQQRLQAAVGRWVTRLRARVPVWVHPDFET